MGVDVGCRPTVVGVASLHGWPPSVPGHHLVFYVFSFEVGNGGSRVAGKAFPCCPFFGEDVCAFVSFDTNVVWNPVNVGPDSS